MIKAAIVYFSKTGNTKTMGEEIAKGMQAVAGVEPVLYDLEKVTPEQLDECQTIVFGTPTYIANFAWQVKKWFDEAHKFKLGGKLGAAYATAAMPQGGADVAIHTLLEHMLVKGMVVYSGGSACGTPFIHLGACAWHDTFEKDKEMMRIFGQRIAQKSLDLFAK